MDIPLIAFLPCRSGSERIPKKNTKKFYKYDFGLFENKIKQLINSKLIDRIIVSTDDVEIIDYIKKNPLHDSLECHPREKNLSSSTTTTDELISYAGLLIKSLYPNCNVLWTHVTSPFINSDIYDSAIKQYLEMDKNKNDSLMSVTPLKNFIWNKEGPLNYDRKKIKWPLTQSLEKVYEINSGIFISSIESYILNNDRIGKSPCLYELDKISGFDIDWEEDFQLAELYAEYYE